MRNLLNGLKYNDTIYGIINVLILIDLLLIAYLLISNFSTAYAEYIIIFDVLLCIFLLADMFYKLLKSGEKLGFLKYNIPFIVASIPFELFLPVFFISFRFLLILRLFKLSGVAEKYFESIHLFVESTKLDWVLTWVALTVVIFTFTIYFLDSSMDLFDSFWYVVVTLTTVGYGDVTPNEFSAKVVSIMLLLLGICIFSILTGAISSYFTDKILDIRTDTEDELDTLDEKVKMMNSQLDDIKEELERSRAENKKLHEKLDKLLKD